ncbi:hypothetical protein H2200_004127 [Cladophialophora chaetospira]|uniref:Heterokaryon incompatibility domain-containing protein n=1 Tax=Cladophialophora chaetospira TaxID=386627 RepID=A0AA39CLD5_9EURO|nr:hypothetical protein H2200_004127 [Cladophialophora chaetospira]
MRLLKFDNDGSLSLTDDLQDVPSYAILSHTWGADSDEVNFDDIQHGSGMNKPSYAKIRFCGEQARKDKLEYFWVDTCCINKANHTEYSEAINSMFRWYRDAAHCYVYLSDVLVNSIDDDGVKRTWKVAFRKSRYFKRGWTLQELLAPTSVEFFSQEGDRLGSKNTLEQQIHEITGIPVVALRNAPLSQFTVDERMGWAAKRDTKKKEDKAYCLLGIFGVFMPLIYGEGENALVRLRETIDKSRNSTSRENGNIHWMVPRSSNALFTGREDILDSLEKTVRAAAQDCWRTDPCCIVISGLGGQGKSEISLQLAQRVRSLLWGVFWVDVSTPSLAENGYLDIAGLLQISASRWEDGRQGLANISKPWMLVLDNADDPHVDYQAYFPPGLCGVVVLTSRNADCQQYATADAVALEGLPIDEATELLLKAAGFTHDQRSGLEDDALGVAALLQSHALALIQAGAYVGRGHCTLGEYPEVYERQRKRLLGFRPTQAQSRYRDVYATFEASVGTLQASETQSSRDALELLPLLAVCGPNHIPLLLFESAWREAQRISGDQSDYHYDYHSDDQSDDVHDLEPSTWHVSRLPLLIQAYEDAWDSIRLVEAVNALKVFALVSTSVNNEHMLVSMHPLVHAWARDRQHEQQQHASWIAMGCVVAVSRSDGAMWRVHGRQLRPHLQAITSWEMRSAFQSEPNVDVACIWTKCGWLLQAMGDDKTLFILLNRLCSYLGLDESAIDTVWVNLFNLKAQNHLDCGRIKDAVQLLEKLVQTREHALTEDHPSRLVSQYILATAYRVDGQVQDAVKLLEEVVRISQTLAEDQPDRLASQHELARAYQADGQLNKALQLLEEVVRLRSQILAEDHPDRLSSQHALALAYQADEQVEKAVSLLEEVVRIQAQMLAEDHPDQLASQHGLARAYQANGQVEKAVQLLEEVVQIQAQMLAEDHSNRLTSEHLLCTMLWKTGQRSRALKMMRNVVEIRRRVLDHDHPKRTLSEEWLDYFEDESSKWGQVA